MKVSTCDLAGVLIMEPKTYADERGFFLESFERERFLELGIVEKFVQENHSRSKRNVLRGLHFTRHRPQAQVVTVIRGKIFDVVVDIRSDSPTFGKWFGTELGDQGPRQVYMPHGFAHGFCVLSEFADLHYKVSQKYDPDDNAGLTWNDPTVGIEWPVRDPLVSERDSAHPVLQNINNP
jgi:dTDP-4-dehydrorhamnose 3,5-epimerase